MAISNNRKVSLKSKERPSESADRAEELNERPGRPNVGGRKNFIPSIEGLNPNYVYRFIKDTTREIVDKEGNVTLRPGQRIMELENIGWSFVKKDEVRIAETTVYETTNLGSIVRIPGGLDEYLYLMKIKREWYEDDQNAKAKQIRETEKELGSAYSQEVGSYGSVKFE